jgi:hypothetical protein
MDWKVKKEERMWKRNKGSSPLMKRVKQRREEEE